jgi:hypothetical protein
VDILIKDSKPTGNSRTKADQMLQDHGWGSSFKSEEAADKCAYLERKAKKNLGLNDSSITARWINLVK